MSGLHVNAKVDDLSLRWELPKQSTSASEKSSVSVYALTWGKLEGGSEQCQVPNASKEVARKGDSDDKVGKEKLDYLG